MKKVKKETYFWRQFIKLCNQRNLRPNNVTQAIGMSNAAATDWKNGAEPRDTALNKLADYFGVPVEYFKEDSAHSTSGKIIIGSTFSDHEKLVIMAYRTHPEMQPAIDKLLGIAEEGTSSLLAAARSTDNHGIKVVQKANEKWQAIEDAPDTDSNLM